MATLLSAALTRHEVEHAVHDADGQTTVAVHVDDRATVGAVLTELAESEPALMVRGGHRPKPSLKVRASELEPTQLQKAQWLAVGVPLRLDEHRVGSEGFVGILFVTWVEAVQRLLALYKRAHRPDWTGEFHTARGGTASAGSTDTPVLVREVGGPEVRGDLVGPVDIVYTWVDSSDPAWQRTRRDHATTDADLPSADNDERYLDREELRYSLRSLELFAPFVRRVHLVTADQVPDWLETRHPRLHVVSHRDIFPDEGMLPTFNSHAIEACLHRIPGLSENYLYLNDDVLFGQEVTKHDFFTAGGLKKIRFGFGVAYDGRPQREAIPTDWAAHNANVLLEREFGLWFKRKLKHVQHPQKRSLLYELEERFPREIDETRRARFRSENDLALPSMLAGFYAVATGRGVEWPHVPYEYVYADTGAPDWEERRDRILEKRPKFICVNATRHRHYDLEEQERNLRSLLDGLFPVPSRFERSVRAPAADDAGRTGDVSS
jgi:hypothetical protein